MAVWHVMHHLSHRPASWTIRGVELYVVLTDSKNMPETALGNAIAYEDFIDGHDSDYEWPVLDEGDAASLCYTSGTTGHPKGALFSHSKLRTWRPPGP